MTCKVSIAFHNGKVEFIPLLQNLIKSFLVCNEYSNVELILIESAGNKDVRDWFSRIDFDKNFVNFDGTTTSIIKNSKTNIEKTCLFLDFSDDVPWYVCYMSSLEAASKKAAGEYFVFLAEDNQFICKGNVIQDYVTLLENVGKESNMINFTAMQNYKYFKDNNSYSQYQEVENILYFPVHNTKWDPTYLCHRSIYEQLGDFVLGDQDDPHATINNFINKSKDLGFKRLYKAIPPSIWFHNETRAEYIEQINKNTLSDPNYILFTVCDLDEMHSRYTHLRHRPLGTDDMFDRISVPQ